MTASPEEVILDFALNQQPFNQMAQTLPIGQRVVLSYYTAKRFLAALQLTIQRHESTFGEIDVDVQRRAQGQRR